MREYADLARHAAIRLRAAWAQRWVGLAAAWAVGMAAVGYLLLATPQYEATARIFVNTDSILKPLMTGLTVQPNEDQRISMLGRVVISRPNVEKLVGTVGLDAAARSPEERSRIVDRAMRTLQFRGSGRDNLYTLSFRDADPARARRAVELLASTFIESSKGGSSSDAEAAKAFIDEQIGHYEKKLQEAEGRLKDFRVRNLGLTPGEGGNFFLRMSETERALMQARLELREAERAREALRRGLAGAEPAAGPAPSAELEEVDGRLDAMRRNLDTLLRSYTEEHPDVVGARRVIRDLEKSRLQAVARGGTRQAPATIAGPRASETLKVSLAQAEAAVASLSARVGEYAERYKRLRVDAALVPQLEAEHAQLNRDYEIIKKNYETLVARRESANISGEMQAVSGVSDFRLVDPPRVSPRPVWPRTTILFPLAFGAALFAGVLVAYVLAESRPTFYDGRALREATGLPVLGTVSLVRSATGSVQARRDATRFAAAAGALLALFILGFAWTEAIAVRVA